MNLVNKNSIELSVVVPCLNESETIGQCIEQITAALKKHNINGEIIIADNGSKDSSREIASLLGVKVVEVPLIGYGNALMGGINQSNGKYLLVGDADGSYDFSEIPKFIEKLNEGLELVMGCRLPSGGGKILKGAMPFLHRRLGNHLFSFLVRLWFGAKIHDVHCGIRAFTKELYERLNMKCTGMEFASEMVIKASIFKAKICEVPVTLYPDKRKINKKHLRTFRDGWRHLRFYLMYSPRWLFLLPGFFLFLAGVIGYIVVLFNLKIFNRLFDIHTLLFASLFILCGYQSMIFAFLAKAYAINEGLKPSDLFTDKFYKYVTLEKGLLAGVICMLFGLTLLLFIIFYWKNNNLGALNPSYTMRWIIPGATLTVLGFQTTLFSFFASMLGLGKLHRNL